jgi:hypothetical protein
MPVTLVSAQHDSIKLGKLPIVRHKASKVPLYSMNPSWLYLILAPVPAGNNRWLLNRHTRRPYDPSPPQARMVNCKWDMEYSPDGMGTDSRNTEANPRFVQGPRVLRVCPSLYSHQAYPPDDKADLEDRQNTRTPGGGGARLLPLGIKER